MNPVICTQDVDYNISAPGEDVNEPSMDYNISAPGDGVNGPRTLTTISQLLVRV